MSCYREGLDKFEPNFNEFETVTEFKGRFLEYDIAASWNISAFAADYKVTNTALEVLVANYNMSTNDDMLVRRNPEHNATVFDWNEPVGATPPSPLDPNKPLQSLIRSTRGFTRLAGWMALTETALSSTAHYPGALIGNMAVAAGTGVYAGYKAARKPLMVDQKLTTMETYLRRGYASDAIMFATVLARSMNKEPSHTTDILVTAYKEISDLRKQEQICANELKTDPERTITVPDTQFTIQDSPTNRDEMCAMLQASDDQQRETGIPTGINESYQPNGWIQEINIDTRTLMLSIVSHPNFLSVAYDLTGNLYALAHCLQTTADSFEEAPQDLQRIFATELTSLLQWLNAKPAA